MGASKSFRPGHSFPVAMLLRFSMFTLTWALLCRNVPGIQVAFPETRGMNNRSKTEKPKGVFVYKVSDVENVLPSLCMLTLYFNGHAKYPVRIFADADESHLSKRVKRAGGGADVQIHIDHKSWRDVPDLGGHDAAEKARRRHNVFKHCDDGDSGKMICATLPTPIGYIHMGYWRYRGFQFEPLLQPFDYFISLDADAFATSPWPLDPFQVMHDNRLTGIFNILAYQSGPNAEGVSETVKRNFQLSDRRNRFLDSPSYSFFDDDGEWGGENFHTPKQRSAGVNPSIWGNFYGGRLDFFRSSKFLDFTSEMVYHTYLSRTDEQPIIAAAWALLTNMTDVWYLPAHNINLNIWHHNWRDNTEILAGSNRDNPMQGMRNNTLWSWRDFKEHGPEDEVTLQEYLTIKRPLQEWATCNVP